MNYGRVCKRMATYNGSYNLFKNLGGTCKKLGSKIKTRKFFINFLYPITLLVSLQQQDR